MGDQSTGPDASGEGTQDYAAKYNGLQQAFQKRQNEIALKEQAWAAKEAEYEAKMARLTELEAKEQAAVEEANARAQYEALQARFEEEPPTPQSLAGMQSAVSVRNARFAGGDDGSAGYLKKKLAKQAGLTDDSAAWPGG
jgi:predicted nuclease with TOPRIM domain